MFEVVLTDEAKEHLRSLRRGKAVAVLNAIETYLKHEPDQTSKSRIKCLRELSQPQYGLRVGEIRVFYDIEENRVSVLGVVPKSQAERWLKEKGKQ